MIVSAEKRQQAEVVGFADEFVDFLDRKICPEAADPVQSFGFISPNILHDTCDLLVTHWFGAETVLSLTPIEQLIEVVAHFDGPA